MKKALILSHQGDELFVTKRSFFFFITDHFHGLFVVLLAENTNCDTCNDYSKYLLCIIQHMNNAIGNGKWSLSSEPC